MPARITGRRAAVSVRTGSPSPCTSTEAAAGASGGRLTWPSAGIGQASAVTVRWTAPGRSAAAVRSALRMTVSAEAGSRRRASLLTGANIRSWSTTWWVKNCSRLLSICPEIASIGTRSRVAEATPFSTAVDPGPSVDRQTPGRPEVIAAASAMNAAVPSRTADTTWTPRCLAASMKSMIDSPG